jgi:ArsR family transcriptional regulator
MLSLDDKEMAEIKKNAPFAAGFLRTLANENRLIILCILSQGERNVRELERTLELRQPTLSQQLSVLREQRLVATRRNGKEIYYRLASEEAQAVIGLLYELFCAKQGAKA